jgi:hypothetical protein
LHQLHVNVPNINPKKRALLSATQLQRSKASAKIRQQMVKHRDEIRKQLDDTDLELSADQRDELEAEHESLDAILSAGGRKVLDKVLDKGCCHASSRCHYPLILGALASVYFIDLPQCVA